VCGDSFRDDRAIAAATTTTPSPEPSWWMGPPSSEPSWWTGPPQPQVNLSMTGGEGEGGPPTMHVCPLPAGATPGSLPVEMKVSPWSGGCAGPLPSVDYLRPPRGVMNGGKSGRSPDSSGRSTSDLHHLPSCQEKGFSGPIAITAPNATTITITTTTTTTTTTMSPSTIRDAAAITFERFNYVASRHKLNRIKTMSTL
jgi:hypothetical protein